MQSQKNIEMMRDYIQKLYLDNFSNASGKDLLEGKNPFDIKYTSPFIDPDTDEHRIFEGEEAFAIMGNLCMTLRTLEWVLEEGDCYREVKDEAEAIHYEHKVRYDGKGKNSFQILQQRLSLQE